MGVRAFQPDALSAARLNSRHLLSYPFLGCDPLSKTPNTKRPPCILSDKNWPRTFVVSSALLSPFAVFAQTPAQTRLGRTRRRCIMLSAFQVDSSKDRGYVASQSMTGARTAILLKDLPFTVDVIPSEFLKDFSLFELNDNVAYVGGFCRPRSRGAPSFSAFHVHQPAARRFLPPRPLRFEQHRSHRYRQGTQCLPFTGAPLRVAC